MTATAIVCPSGIYAITNSVTGKKYIGSAFNLRVRKGQHFAKLGRGVHHSAKLQRSWDKHGPDAFDFSVIEFVEDKSNLITREQFWIDSFAASTAVGYNMRPIAASMLGVKQSPETIAKRRLLLIGAKCSDATKEKIRQMAIGRKQSPEQIEKRVSKIRGIKQTAEHIHKASVARIGRKNTPETIEKMRAWVKTDETKAKMSAWQIGRTLPPESIAKREATKKANRLAKSAD